MQKFEEQKIKKNVMNISIVEIKYHVYFIQLVSRRVRKERRVVRWTEEIHIFRSVSLSVRDFIMPICVDVTLVCECIWRGYKIQFLQQHNNSSILQINMHCLMPNINNILTLNFN